VIYGHSSIVTYRHFWLNLAIFEAKDLVSVALSMTTGQQRGFVGGWMGRLISGSTTHVRWCGVSQRTYDTWRQI